MDPVKFILTVIFIKSKLLSIQCFLRSKLSLVIQQVFLFILNAVAFDKNSLKPLMKTVMAGYLNFSFKIICLKIKIRSLGPLLIADKIFYHE